MTKLEVYVTPGSRRPGPDGRHGGLPRLRVASPPADGRANTEAERLLSGIMGADVTLLSGGRSRRKVFSTPLNEAAVEAKLSAAFGDA